MKFERAHRIISYCVVTIADEFYSLGAAMHTALELIWLPVPHVIFH